ncbi:MAG: hypothetical protein JXC32_07095, partial [Anaerolineae bacterium]|nr:hypothetical protein [Anaerolineae bacterium]
MRDCADTPINLAYWRFQADPTGIGASLGYAQAAYDDRRWREVRAPVDFETCHPALDTYEGAGWFRHRLTAPEAWSGRRIVLRLEGVNARAVVWVNGAEVGRCTDPFLPFEIEIQEALVPGDQNLIAVRVDNVRQQGEVPGMQRGWRNYGGLLREVTIRATDLCHLASVACVATPTETGGHLQVTATVQNDRPLDVEIALAAEVGDGTGQLLVTLPPVRRGLAAGASVASALTSDVPHALPWSPDQPNRYELRVTLLAGGEMVGSRTLKIGFRTIEARGPMLYLNGSP